MLACATCNLSGLRGVIKKRMIQPVEGICFCRTPQGHQALTGGWLSNMVCGSTWTGIVNIDRLSQRIIVALPDTLWLLQASFFVILGSQAGVTMVVQHRLDVILHKNLTCVILTMKI